MRRISAKHGCFARRLERVVMEIVGVGLQAERISLKPTQNLCSVVLQEQVPSLSKSSLKLLFASLHVYIS